MKRLRLLGLALMAMFAVGAITAATTSANPTILPTPSEKEPILFTSEGGVSTLKGGGGTIECDKILNKGDFTTSEHAKDVEIDFHSNCKLAGGGSKCKSEADVNGIILLLADLLLVDILPVAGELTLGLLVLILNAKLEDGAIVITCGIAKIEVKGGVIGRVDKNATTKLLSLEKVTSVLLLLHENAAKKQEFKECDFLEATCLNKEGKHIVYELLAKFTAGEEFKEGVETTEDTIKFEKAGVAREVEFHF